MLIGVIAAILELGALLGAYLPEYTQINTLDEIPFSLHVVRISLIVRKRNTYPSVPDSHISRPYFNPERNRCWTFSLGEQ